jgi:hypothetical protein
MINISDADLMAYADGVLPRHARPLVRQALLRDPALLEKLECYIITNRGLAAPFARLPPVPDRLRRVLAQEHSVNERRWLGILRAAAEAKLADRLRLPVWSLAAICALICAAVLAWQLPTRLAGASQLAELEARGLSLSVPFQRALERTESNVPAQLATLKPTGTFLSTANEWCRQYELLRDEGTWVQGVACRSPGGEWHVKTAAMLSTTPPASGYAPAGQEPPGRKDLAGLDTAIGKLMRDVVLLPPDEKRLIAGGWLVPRARGGDEPSPR